MQKIQKSRKAQTMNVKNATPIVAHTATERKTENTFDALKRQTEIAMGIGGDIAARAMVELGKAYAGIAVNKCADPQRKTAVDRDTVSDNGMNPALLQLRREVFADVAALDNLHDAMNAALAARYNDNGDMVTEIVDRDAWARADILSRDRLGDGMDLVQDAVLELLEQQAAGHDASGAGWLDMEYIVRKLDRRVLIREDESAAYHDVETTPAQAIFQAVRRSIADSRAMQTDPRNGYTYLEELTADGLDTVYRRIGKYSDLCGYAHNGQISDMAGAPAGWYGGDGLATADRQTVGDMAKLLARLNLTDRQAQILKYRMQGMGIRAIATRLGVTYQCVQITLKRMQKRLEELGITPDEK